MRLRRQTPILTQAGWRSHGRPGLICAPAHQEEDATFGASHDGDRPLPDPSVELASYQGRDFERSERDGQSRSGLGIERDRYGLSLSWLDARSSDLPVKRHQITRAQLLHSAGGRAVG
jgi:hypothetical protein